MTAPYLGLVVSASSTATKSGLPAFMLMPGMLCGPAHTIRYFADGVGTAAAAGSSREHAAVIDAHRKSAAPESGDRIGGYRLLEGGRRAGRHKHPPRSILCQLQSAIPLRNRNSIPALAHREDVPRFGGILLELAPQLGHVGVDRAAVHFARVAP